MSLSKSKVLLLVVCLFPSLISACAFGNRKITLTYTPVNAAAGNAASGREVIVNKLEDGRSEKMYVGEVRNGYGMVTAHVIANNDTSEWVSNAIVGELGQAGFKVLKGTGQQDPARITLSGAVTQAYCDMYMTQRASVSINIVIARGGQQLLAKTFTGEGKIVAVTASASSYAKVLDMALQDLMRKAIPEIVGTLSNNS